MCSGRYTYIPISISFYLSIYLPTYLYAYLKLEKEETLYMPGMVP